MLETGRLSVRQLVVLVLLTQIGDMILIYPAVITFFAHQDAWISALIGIPAGLLSVWILLKLYRLQPGQTLIQSMKSIWGPWLGGLMAIWYLFYFASLSSIATREVGDFLTTQILPDTPIRIIHLLFVLVLLWGVMHGIESLGRAGELLLPIVTLFILILIACIIPQADFNRVRPVGGTGLGPIMQGAAVTVAYPFGEVIALTMLLPYTAERRNRSGEILLAVLIGGLLLASIVLIAISVLGAFFTQHSIYATFVMSQRISIGNFLERIEAIMASVWIMSTYFKAALYFYCFVLGTAQLFELRTFRPLILPTGMILFGMANVIAPNITYYVSLIVPYWIDWDLTGSTAIPLMSMLLYYLKKRLAGNKLEPGQAGS